MQMFPFFFWDMKGDGSFDNWLVHKGHARTKRADLQQICNRSVLTKTDQLQTTLSSAESVFSLLQTLSLNTLRDVKTADAKQTNNRSADYLQRLQMICNTLKPKSRYYRWDSDGSFVIRYVICYSIREDLVEIELGVRDVSKQFIFSKMKMRNSTLAVVLLQYICCMCSPSSWVKGEKTIFRRIIISVFWTIEFCFSLERAEQCSLG